MSGFWQMRLSIEFDRIKNFPKLFFFVFMQSWPYHSPLSRILCWIGYSQLLKLGLLRIIDIAFVALFESLLMLPKIIRSSTCTTDLINNFYVLAGFSAFLNPPETCTLGNSLLNIFHPRERAKNTCQKYIKHFLWGLLFTWKNKFSCAIFVVFSCSMIVLNKTMNKCFKKFSSFDFKILWSKINGWETHAEECGIYLLTFKIF